MRDKLAAMEDALKVCSEIIVFAHFVSSEIF